MGSFHSDYNESTDTKGLFVITFAKRAGKSKFVTAAVAAALAVAAFTLSACATNTTPVLRLGTFLWPGYEPLSLAIDQGFISESTVSMIEFSSATQLTKAYRNGTVDAATLTLDEVLLLASIPSQDLQIVFAMDFSNGGDAMVAKPEFKSLTDLKGRRIGVEDTALGAYMLVRVLDFAKMAINDVEIVSMPVNEHAQSFKNDLVDAVITFEPVSGALMAEGANKLFDSSQIPNEIMDVLVVRKGYLEKNPDVVLALVTGWFEALEYQRQYPEVTAQFMAQRNNISAQAFMDSLGGLQFAGVEENRKLFSNRAQELKARIKTVEAVMLQYGLIRAPIDSTTIIDETTIQRYLDKHPK